jgi:hypothetical protein
LRNEATIYGKHSLNNKFLTRISAQDVYSKKLSLSKGEKVAGS